MSLRDDDTRNGVCSRHAIGHYEMALRGAQLHPSSLHDFRQHLLVMLASPLACLGVQPLATI